MIAEIVFIVIGVIIVLALTCVIAIMAWKMLLDLLKGNY